MKNVLAVLFRFSQFIFEYGPFFLASWLGLAMITGLIAALQRKGINLKTAGSFLKYRPLRWIWHLLFSLLWHPGGKVAALPIFSGALLFSFTASVPALVATSLISMEAVLLRLILTTIFALSLGWFVTSVISHKQESPQEGQPEEEMLLQSTVLPEDISAAPSGRPGSLVRTTWKSFTGQIDRAIAPLIIGFILASIITIYIPANSVRLWLGDGAWQGPYLAALMATPFQLAGGAEVALASALMVKGASLGTALSVLLAAPGTTLFVIRRLPRSGGLKATVLYLIAVWFVAGSLGAAVDGIQRFLGG